MAKHESANFKSNVFLRCGNPFGLKTFAVTDCKAPISEDGNRRLYYMSFIDMKQAVSAFIGWLEKRGITPHMSDEEILIRMGKAGYYQDKNYVEKVLKWKRE